MGEGARQAWGQWGVWPSSWKATWGSACLGRGRSCLLPRRPALHLLAVGGPGWLAAHPWWCWHLRGTHPLGLPQMGRGGRAEAALAWRSPNAAHLTFASIGVVRRWLHVPGGGQGLQGRSLSPSRASWGFQEGECVG